MSTTGEAGQFPSAAGLVLGYSHRQSLAGPAMCPTLAFASVSQGSSFLHVKVMLLIHVDGGEGAAPCWELGVWEINDKWTHSH